MPKYLSKIVKGNDEIIIKDATARSNKADKVSGATNNNLAALNSNGNLKDAGVSVADLQEDNKNALNQAVMLMLANFAGMPLKLNNAEWKYVYTDSEDHVLFGKKQDNTWSWGDDTDDLLDDVLDLYAADDTLFSDIYRLSVALSLARMSGTLSEIQNPEWKWVVVDSEDKVLMGIKQDNSWYLGCTINELVDCVLATYTVAGATHGTSLNRPTTPDTGQMFFDETLGYPIWYNGTAWVNASGTVES